MAGQSQQSSGSTALVLIAVAIICVGLGFFIGKNNVSPNAGTAPTEAGSAAPSGLAGKDSTKIPVGDSYTYGPADAPVTIVEFTSMQCPFCGRAGGTLMELAEKYPNDVRLVFKNFPLSFQAQAKDGARVVMAAGRQGKFWEMKSKMFENLQRYRGSDMKELGAEFAAELGLDVEKFKADYDDPAIVATIEADQKLGESLGVRGTPHFFVNGEVVNGAQPLAKFEEVVKKQLGEVEELLAAGTSRDGIYAAMVDKNFKKAPAPTPSEPKAEPATEVHMVPVRDADYSKGASADKALVTIMEFSSFQCPFCSRGSATIKELVAKYPNEVRVVFKHFPLGFQAQSEPAARASIAAGNQGKFWEMYDLLYENQRQLGDAKFEELAQQIGLNMTKFKADYAAPETAEIVKQAQRDGQSAGIRGTPGFLVNGIKVVGAQPLAVFEDHVKKQIAIAKKIKADRNLSGDALYEAVVEHNKENVAAAPAAPARPAAPAPKIDTDALSVGNSHTFGPANAPVTIYEFSSFQCPFCARGAETLDRVKEEYGDKVRVVYKNFPLGFQAQSEPAARAALAAGKQGKFWEMYHLLYENQRSFRDEGIWERLAGELGLNMTKFKADFEDPAIAEQVKAEQKEGQSVGVSGTPAFFINGTRVVGAQPFEKFKELIDAELEG
ncbi:thioredoxin [Lujinxingia litoralis]|uniref:Thioredoxin n=1 Tax=Lujinxingia litoralis TaxID=2211119 RepID=A0A328C7I0_9DELT|nr:thioredoxin domain-containing protein [Lujinxingia litoralis]RAL20504.1 thioredoxin [Lujinxingia litoralis]